MRGALITAVTALVALIPAGGRATAAEPQKTGCRSAMAPYYAALLASAHGDADGTLRHLLLLKSRWDQQTRLPLSEGCQWLSDVSGGMSVAAAVAARIDTARSRLPRDVSGAHAELEAVRLLLRDTRARHGLRTFDDALTDYHDALERLENLIGGRNEVALTVRDFDAIRDQATVARAAWGDVESRHHEVIETAGWSAASHRTEAQLKAIGESASGRSAIAVHEAAVTVRSQYFDLLRILSRLG